MESPVETSVKIAAVVVTFNPDDAFAARLSSYRSQVDHTFIVDNSPDPAAAARVRMVADSFPRDVSVIANGKNIGLAAAQNLGITKAMAAGASWVLLMDDDSLVPQGMVAAMMNAQKEDRDPASIGLLAPRIIDRNSGHEGKMIVQEGILGLRRRAFNATQERVCDTVLTVIASGSLVSVRALEKIGLMKEPYFVDGVDIEYALRLRKNGFRILVVREACLSHSLGKKSLHRFCGLTFVTTNHRAWRRYTMYRNRVDIWKNYSGDFPVYVAYDFFVSLFEMLKIALFETDKMEKLRACCRGALGMGNLGEIMKEPRA